MALPFPKRKNNEEDIKFFWFNELISNTFNVKSSVSSADMCAFICMQLNLIERHAMHKYSPLIICSRFGSRFGL